MSRNFDEIIDNVAADNMLPIELVDTVVNCFLDGLSNVLAQGHVEVDCKECTFRSFVWDEGRHGGVVLFKPWVAPKGPSK